RRGRVRRAPPRVPVEPQRPHERGRTEITPRNPDFAGDGPMPFAARVGDLHTCPLAEPGPKPHVGGPILAPGCATVHIGGRPAARVGDQATCTGPTDVISAGSAVVSIGRSPAAPPGDPPAPRRPPPPPG